MYYQLPNGKVVKLSLEDYLELTDADIQFLMSIDYGDHIIDPFHGSAVRFLKCLKECLSQKIFTNFKQQVEKLADILTLIN